MEEKTSRVAEVIVSSVKPFPLMLGKIIGIGAVGLTQFLMWIGLIFVLVMVAQAFIPHELLQEVNNIQKANAMGSAQVAQYSEAARQISSVQQSIHSANWLLIISCFVFYFIGGYLFYASLFAAVGSVVNEDPQESAVTAFADQYAHHLFIYHYVHSRAGSGWSAGGLGQYDPLQFTDCHDGAHTLRCAHYSSLLAAAAEYGPAGRRVFIFDLDGRKNLQNGHTDVWKKTELENDVEMGV